MMENAAGVTIPANEQLLDQAKTLVDVVLYIEQISGKVVEKAVITHWNEGPELVGIHFK